MPPFRFSTFGSFYYSMCKKPHWRTVLLSSPVINLEINLENRYYYCHYIKFSIGKRLHILWLMNGLKKRHYQYEKIIFPKFPLKKKKISSFNWFQTQRKRTSNLSQCKQDCLKSNSLHTLLQKMILRKATMSGCRIVRRNNKFWARKNA